MKHFITVAALAALLSACATSTSPSSDLDTAVAKVKAELPVVQQALSLVKGVPPSVTTAVNDVQAVVDAYQPGQSFDLATVDTDLGAVLPFLPSDVQAAVVVTEAAVAAAQ